MTVFDIFLGVALGVAGIAILFATTYGLNEAEDDWETRAISYGMAALFSIGSLRLLALVLGGAA